MKKMRIYYLAMAVMTAVCITSCDDKKDDDIKDAKQSVIVTPKYSEQACVIRTKEVVIKNQGKKLNFIEFAESGKVYMELQDEVSGAKSIVNDKFTFDKNSNTYTFPESNNYIKGSVKELPVMKAETDTKVEVDFTIKLSSGITLEMKTTADVAIEAIKVIGDKKGDQDVLSTWKMRSIGIKLYEGDSEDGFSKVFRAGADGVDLKDILAEAKDQGVEFSDDEEKPLQKTVQFVSVTSTHIYIDYSDGTSDGADWNWVNSSLSDKINMKLIERGMGNKFIVDDPSVGIEFAKDKGYLTISLNANVSGDKSYRAILELHLEQVSEAK